MPRITRVTAFQKGNVLNFDIPCGARVRKFKDVVSSCGFLTPAEWPMCTDCALNLDRTLERSGQCAGVEGS
jgi:hypothetical protein